MIEEPDLESQETEADLKPEEQKLRNKGFHCAL